MIYPAKEPPFEFVDFREMDKRQAKEYFDWYLACIPERVKLLDECFNSVWKDNVRFDYSVESLPDIWGSFENHIETEEKTKADIEKELAETPEWLHETILQETWKLKMLTLAIAMDIAMYYGEVIVRTLPGVHWGFFTTPRSMRSVNRPVILGFMYNKDLDPREIVLTGCHRSVRERNSEFLRTTLEVWRKFLPV